MQNVGNQVIIRGGRAVGLDLLRISLALLIFMFHSRIHALHCHYGILNSFVDMGAIAMTGFFLLSGYVLNLTYQSKDMTNQTEIRRFYLKRIISIFPLYFTWAFIHIIANIVLRGQSALIQEIVLFPVEFLGIQSVFSSLFLLSHNGGSWFISCIMICYFIFPLIHLLTKGLSDRIRFVIIVLVEGVLLYSPFVQHYFHLQTIYSNPFFRILEFTIGILVSQLNTSAKPCKLIVIIRNPLVCVASLVCLISGISIARMINIPSDFMLYSWVALPCFISLLISLGHFEFKKMEQSKTIKYLSELSFCIFLGQISYVWYVVKYGMGFIGCDANIIKIVLSFFIVFCIANFLHFFVEIPSSKFLKHRLLAK